MIRPVMFRGLVFRAVEFQFGQGLQGIMGLSK